MFFFYYKRWTIVELWGDSENTTNIKLKDFQSESNAIETFKEVFKAKGGNDWSDREKPVKKPGKMFPLQIDYNNVSGTKK